MTECTPTPLTFSSLAGRRLHADFSGGALTTDAGMLLLRQADKPAVRLRSEGVQGNEV